MDRPVRNLLIVLAGLALLWFGGRAAWRAAASPEQKIRWRLESMVDGFQSMRAQPVLDGLARNFVDPKASVGREEVRSILAWMFLNELDAVGGFLWSARFDSSEAVIELSDDREAAKVSLAVGFFRREQGEEVLAWNARIEGRMERTDAGWQWTLVESANHEDRRR